MNNVSIHLDHEAGCFTPGDTLAGTVEWAGAAKPRRVEVRLFWFTSGIALKQVGIVSRLVVKNHNQPNSARFEFILPAGPWSFSGPLLTLNWAAEVVLFPSKESAFATFTFGPNGTRIGPCPQEDRASDPDQPFITPAG